jgi:hypothetical protein
MGLIMFSVVILNVVMLNVVAPIIDAELRSSIDTTLISGQCNKLFTIVNYCCSRISKLVIVDSLLDLILQTVATGACLPLTVSYCRKVFITMP